ncbi:MAG: flippase-like domain-containing protein [Myxococcales bacterium]|nr:flippase-like domain-containing protein [Myxococcales bacterium]MCB9702022.1 flippase-like domain-containing protein [Myxococcales bacterium]
MTTDRRRRLWSAAKLVLGIALLIAVVRWITPDLAAIAERAEPAPLLGLVGLCGTVIAALVTSARWKVMVEAMGGTRLPYAIYFHGLVLTKVLGQFTSTLAMDLVGRGLALRSAGSERGLGHAMTQAILERLFDLLLPAVFLVWALAIHQAAATGGIVVATFAAILAAFALLAALILWPLAQVALRAYLWIAARRGRQIADEVREELLTTPIDRGLAARVGILSVLRYVAILGQYWAVAGAVGIALEFRTIALAAPVGQLAGIIGVTPGALGIQEAGWAGAFGWLGALDPAAIGLFVLSQRALVLAFFALLSLLSWPWARRARRRPGSVPKDSYKS